MREYIILTATFTVPFIVLALLNVLSSFILNLSSFSHGKEVK